MGSGYRLCYSYSYSCVAVTARYTPAAFAVPHFLPTAHAGWLLCQASTQLQFFPFIPLFLPPFSQASSFFPSTPPHPPSVSSPPHLPPCTLFAPVPPLSRLRPGTLYPAPLRASRPPNCPSSARIRSQVSLHDVFSSSDAPPFFVLDSMQFFAVFAPTSNQLSCPFRRFFTSKVSLLDFVNLASPPKHSSVTIAISQFVFASIARRPF